MVTDERLTNSVQIITDLLTGTFTLSEIEKVLSSKMKIIVKNDSHNKQ